MEAGPDVVTLPLPLPAGDQKAAQRLLEARGLSQGD
jgi:hypothetical protein